MRDYASGSFDLVCTDPPFGDNRGYGRQNKRMILSNESPVLGLLAMQESFRLLRDNRFALMFLDHRHIGIIDVFFRRYSSFTLRGYVVWDKEIMGLGYGIRARHKLIAVLEKGKPFYGDRGIPSVLRFQREPTPEHPHKKPLSLMSYLIRNFSSPDDVVLDPFCGTGSTLVAAKKLGRRYVGIELDAAHVATAEARLKTFTKPERNDPCPNSQTSTTPNSEPLATRSTDASKSWSVRQLFSWSSRRTSSDSNS